MSAVTRANPLLRPDDTDDGNLALTRFAARLCAPIERHLSGMADVGGLAASCGDVAFGDLQELSAMMFGYRVGSVCPILIAVDRIFAAALVERKFGGARGAAPRSRTGECGATASIAKDIACKVASAIAEAWPGDTLPAIAAEEDTAQFSRADDRVPTITLTWPLGKVSIAFATGSIARLANVPPPARIAGWANLLRDNVMTAPVPVRAVFARPQLPAAMVMHLKVGDVLPISKPVFVPLYTGAHRLGTGILTDTSGRTAVQIHMMETF
ncbi:MAG: hypothetical protein JWL66_1337 [Sphingomonadales bacterium]|nr:hypothetical protein [Sphingomonadales bacterium]